MRLLKDWYQRAEWFTFKDEDLMPTSFSVEFYRVNTMPLYYYASLDKNRWRSWVFAMSIGQWRLHIQVPFKRLPDHVPSERQIKMRNMGKRRSEASQE